MNFAAIRGRMVSDPVLRHNDDGVAVLSFTVAVNKKERADFIDCVCFNHTAEFVERNFKQGQYICASGSIRTNVWEKADGTKAKDVKLLVSEVDFG